jgi:hypothetical protein
MRAAQRKDARAWCAWIDGDASARLYAPTVDRAGVDRARLLVVRPNVKSDRELARVATKVVGSGAFDVVAVRGASGFDAQAVRRLALGIEEQGGVVLLLTDSYASRARGAWSSSCALGLELLRNPDAISVRVARDRRGRTSAARSVSFRRAS